MDSVRSAVRVVLKDGMDRFANSVVQGNVVYKTKDEIQEIVDALIGNLPAPEETPSEPVPAAPRKPTPVDKLRKPPKSWDWARASGSCWALWLFRGVDPHLHLCCLLRWHLDLGYQQG